MIVPGHTTEEGYGPDIPEGIEYERATLNPDGTYTLVLPIAVRQRRAEQAAAQLEALLAALADVQGNNMAAFAQAIRRDAQQAGPGG